MCTLKQHIFNHHKHHVTNMFLLEPIAQNLFPTSPRNNPSIQSVQSLWSFTTICGTTICGVVLLQCTDLNLIPTIIMCGSIIGCIKHQG